MKKTGIGNVKVVAAQKIRDRIFACFDITFPIPVFSVGLSSAGLERV